MDNFVSIETIASLFGVSPSALLMMAAIIMAVTEWLKAKIPTLVGNWILVAPFAVGIVLGLLLPGVTVVTGLRVGILSALASTVFWELFKGSVKKVAEIKRS